jgi:hypothetical protein
MLRRDGAIVELTVDKSSARAAVTRGLERVKLKISTVRSPGQGTADEDTAGWKNLASAVVICEVWKLATALKVLVAPTRVYKQSINRVTNPYPVYTHT